MKNILKKITIKNLGCKNFVPKFLRFTGIRLNNFCKILDNRCVFSLFEGPHWAKFNTRKVAFTLAEVLITIAIVGAVAALTLPILMQNIQMKYFNYKLKRVQEDLAQATKLLEVEYGVFPAMICSKYDNNCFRDIFATKIKVIKKCAESKAVIQGCMAPSIKSLSWFNPKSYPAFVSLNGYSISFRFHGYDNHDNSVYGWIMVDLNGVKPPNKLNKDVYQFYWRADQNSKHGIWQKL